MKMKLVATLAMPALMPAPPPHNRTDAHGRPAEPVVTYRTHIAPLIKPVC